VIEREDADTLGVLYAAKAVSELGEGVHVFAIDPDNNRWHYHRLTAEEIAAVLALRAAKVGE
jgi:hypothetical protein